MSRPRQILANTTYMVTRRTSQRMFLLRPSSEVNRCIRYCLALAQRRSGVEIHCAVFMSNHYHIVLTDPKGLLPVFCEELNKLIARALNCLHGRWENFWAGGVSCSYVRLEYEWSVMQKTVYALSNPTAAGLVAYGHEWPGLRLFREGQYKASKPSFFFRQISPKGGLPDQLNLVLTPPPIAEELGEPDIAVKKAVALREKELREQRYKEGKGFLGAPRVRAQNIYETPAGPAKRSRISPRVAVADKWLRIEVLSRIKNFEEEHRACRKAYVKGEKEVEFPPGTYQAVRLFGVRCAEQ